jgi:hypothetical protein
LTGADAARVDDDDPAPPDLAPPDRVAGPSSYRSGGMFPAHIMLDDVPCCCRESIRSRPAAGATTLLDRFPSMVFCEIDVSKLPKESSLRRWACILTEKMYCDVRADCFLSGERLAAGLVRRSSSLWLIARAGLLKSQQHY